MAKKPAKPVFEKDMRVLKLFKQGIEAEAIAAQVGLSFQSVRMVILFGPRKVASSQMDGNRAMPDPTPWMIFKRCRRIRMFWDAGERCRRADKGQDGRGVRLLLRRLVSSSDIAFARLEMQQNFKGDPDTAF